jgi:ATP-dependent DNA helicase RecQ
VRGGKSRFDDTLVAACVDLLKNWSPQPRPTWVTAIPSQRHPELVPDFAARLALRLGLPFFPALVKTSHAKPQREMENSAHQVSNLDGTLTVHLKKLPKGPVLLVDDMKDSGWTFTVAGYLLRQAGVGAVLPLALALNSFSDT